MYITIHFWEYTTKKKQIHSLRDLGSGAWAGYKAGNQQKKE